MSLFIKAIALAMEATGSGNTTPFYTDVEPPCNWLSNNGSETLVLYLPEFKKEQLKIQISNMKTLKISGERHLDETKIIRFCKSINVPSNCNANEIHAKFVDGILQIKMPTKNSSFTPQQMKISKIKETGQLDNEKSKAEVSQDQANKFFNSSNEEEIRETKIEMPSHASNIASTNNEIRPFWRFNILSKVAISVAVMAVVVAILGAIIVYSCLFLLK